jgi:hypothetical protein
MSDAFTSVGNARPDLGAQRRAASTEWPVLVSELTDIIGKKLTAYIAGVKDVRTVERWMGGSAPYRDVEPRLRFAYTVAKTLRKSDEPAIVQAWLTGLNPELNDRVPVRLLREGDLEEIGPQVLGAARAFVAGG